MNVSIKKKDLSFKVPSGTSRGILKNKTTYYLILEHEGKTGIGECSTLPGLSIDHHPNYADKLEEVAIAIRKGESSIEAMLTTLKDWPSIQFGLESAKLDLENGGNRLLFPSPFTTGEVGIPINGLIWMGSKSYMMDQAKSLLDRGFRCLKMKIGAINFDEELAILRSIRKEYSKEELILRVDANGAFDPGEALEKLKILSDLDLHSIEQPIKAGQYEQMAELCSKTPLDIALDEELIGSEVGILENIRPQYIILKPSLIGGFTTSEKWIAKAEKLNIGWWTTSALESNIGLNAISQWTYTLDPVGHQGLGTGSLYTNNIESPLVIKGESIYYDSDQKWNTDELF